MLLYPSRGESDKYGGYQGQSRDGDCFKVSPFIIVQFVSVRQLCSTHVKTRWNDHRLGRVEHAAAYRREHVPEAKSLVASARDNILTTWADR